MKSLADVTPDKSTSAAEGVVVNAAGDILGGWKDLADGEVGRQQPPAAEGLDADEQVGGGDWTYGSYHDSTGYHHCWSFYNHKFNKHSASVAWSNHADPPNQVGDTRRRVAAPGVCANAEHPPYKDNRTLTCRVFWNNKA